MYLPIYIFIALVGLCVGSFMNVLIYRIPKGEEFVRTSSHCMNCGHRLTPKELIPVLSFVIQGGKCRECGVRLSLQYPMVEAINGLMWLVVCLLFDGDWLHIALYCALFSLLCVLAFIDWRTFEIPNGISLAIFLLGLVQLGFDLEGWTDYVIGMLAVSLFFLLLYAITRGAGIGMGDIKLMAGSGLLLGWQLNLLALVIGSVSGAVIHLVRMKHGAPNKLAFGPYLAAGIWISALFGEKLISAYLALLGL